MRNSWQTTLPGAGYKIYIYTSVTRSAAKVYLTETSTTPVDAVPQITTDSTGLVKFWVDTNDYDVDQRFDIEIYDKFGKFVGSIKYVNIFDVKEYTSSVLSSRTISLDTEVLNGDKSISVNTPMTYEFLDPNGANRTITLNTPLNTGDRVIIRNTAGYDSEYYLSISDGTNEIERIYPQSERGYIYNGTNWVRSRITPERRITVMHYTWDDNIVVGNGELLNVILPPGKEITIPDGFSLTIEDGGDFLLFSL